MRNITFNHAFINQTKLKNSESKNRAARSTTIALAVGGGLFFLLLGFFLFVVFTISGGGNLLLNYAGVGSIIVAFIFFGLCAHFMDEADENKRRQKRQKIGEFSGQ